MSIALNLGNSQKDKVKQKKSKNVGAKPIASVPASGFSVEFTKSRPIKAIVARRRIVPKNVKEKSPIRIRQKSPTPEVAPKKNFVLAPKYSDNEGSDNDDNNKDSGIELSLNVSEGTGLQEKEKKLKLSRDQRINAKREQRRDRKNKILTKEEIDEGIKKFSQLPGAVKGLKRERPSKKHSLKIPETVSLGQRAVKPVTEKIFTGAPIETVGLHAHCIKNLADILNITQLTTVQLKTIPKALEGRDMLVRSQTGSGKTLAYALPVIEKLQEIRPKLTRTSGISAVVIVPTRELVLQTYEIFIKLLKPFQWIVPGYLTGGEKRKSEKARLRKGINILIGTPGRFVDHLLHTASLRLDKTQFLVLDEGDRMFEMGYERDIRKIVEGINDHKAGKFPVVEDAAQSGKNPFNDKAYEVEEEKVEKPQVSDIKLQTMLLSATLTSAVQRLAGLALKDPLFIDTSDKEPPIATIAANNFVTAVEDPVNDGKLSIPSTIQLSYVVVPPKLRLVTLSGILATAAKKGNLKSVVFMSTVEMVDFHHTLLTETLTERVLDDEDEKFESDSEDDHVALLKGVSVFRLHGSMQQTERTGVFNAFKKCKQGVLLATDVVGRGIDIIEVNLVIQYSPPQNIAEFVHRVGRTARAGRSGQAILFMGPNETDFIRRLEDKRIRISQGDMEPYLKVINEVDEQAHTTQEAASNLQHRFELLLEDDQEVHKSACQAFVSWVRFYSTFPKDLKSIFNVKNAHVGHYAKSFGLREPPKSFSRKFSTPKPQLPENRLTYTERDPVKMRQEKQDRKRKREGPKKSFEMTKRFSKHLQNSKALTMSEFDSGLPSKKMKKK